MHNGTCVTHVPWCMSGSLAYGDGENVPGIPGACAPAILRIWQEAHGRWLLDDVISHGISSYGTDMFSGNILATVPSRRRDGTTAESRFTPSQWETALRCNDVAHWLGASLASALIKAVRLNHHGQRFANVHDVFIITQHITLMFIICLMWNDTSWWITVAVPHLRSI